MNIGFYDPISERWIKPRPEPTPEPSPTVSMGEALLAAVEAKAKEERNEKIWALLKQSAEGCNAPTATGDAPRPPIFADVPADYEPEPAPGYILYGMDFAKSEGWVKPCEPLDYEPVESLGYVYWRKKA